MLVFPRQNLAYLAIPKTGTTAIEAALAPYAGMSFSANPFKHMDFATYRSMVLPLLSAEPEAVCIVRDPQERMRSWYRYLRPRGVVSSFPDMVERLLRGEQIDAEMGMQSDFVRDGGERVTTLIRYDDPLAVDFFANRLKRYVPIHRRNVSKPAKIEALPAELETALAKYLEPDQQLYESIPRLDIQPYPKPPKGQRLIRSTVWAIERMEARVYP